MMNSSWQVSLQQQNDLYEGKLVVLLATWLPATEGFVFSRRSEEKYIVIPSAAVRFVRFLFVTVGIGDHKWQGNACTFLGGILWPGAMASRTPKENELWES